MPQPLQSPRYREFLKKVREARERAGLLQVDVAARLRKPQSYVSKCESGERRVDVVELMDFSELYGVPIDFFVLKKRRKPNPRG